MPTVRRFWTEPYRTSLETTATAVDGARVELAETIFYAESGGQESERGTIGGIEVVNAVGAGDTIHYTLQHMPPFAAGDTVTVEIDWERRYRLMRLHFAAEIVLVLMLELAADAERIGAHISQDKARLDYRVDRSLASLVGELERRANEVIAADYPIVSEFTDPVRQRRRWRIDRFGAVPCGGTHIGSTGEVGPIRLARRNPGKGKERIEITPAASLDSCRDNR